jgi:tRNA nucleotidyltransferase (CCA-adding enzyme)
VNALFYNLNEASVEDFTGKGLQDLRAGILRTPLDPFVTFKDGAL